MGAEYMRDACKVVVDRLLQHDIFYQTFVKTVEVAIHDCIEQSSGVISNHKMAEFIVQRIAGEK